jgi:hypothetical protein
MIRHSLPALLMLLSLAVRAENPPPIESPPDITPPSPAGLNGEEELQPEVKIIKREEDIIYEYRINDQLYMVKIVPRIGYPYYLVDGDGDGSLESRYNTLEPNLVVPRWMIYRW